MLSKIKKNFIPLKSQKYFLIYTLLFALTFTVVFFWFFKEGRTLIYNGDGWTQHYKALVYYGKYLRSIVRELFSQHRLIIPDWDFSIGEGSDVLATLHYYVIGDPFTLPAVFVPTRFMYLYYEASVLLKLYLSGIAFSFLCFETGHKNKYGVLAGSMTYVFCYWAMFNAARHPFFLNPMLYFPLLIMGMERIFQKKKPYLFIISVALSAVSNFYFFYMLVLTTVLYAAVRLTALYRKDLKTGMQMLLKTTLSSILGLGLSAIVFLPSCYAFLGNTRMTIMENGVSLLYPASYYIKLPSLFLTEGMTCWLCMGFAVPVLPAVFLLFQKRKKHGVLKALFLICIVIILFPVFGQILNGFSYKSNRWCWAFALLCSYIVSAMWPSLIKLKRKEFASLSICMAIYLFTCILLEYTKLNHLYKTYGHAVNVFTLIGIALLFLLLLLPSDAGTEFLNRKRRQQLGIALLLLSVFINGLWKFSLIGDKYAQKGVKAEGITEQLMGNEVSAVKQFAETKDFYRLSGQGLTRNANMVSVLSSTQYYWTLSNPYVSAFRKSLELADTCVFSYEGYESRASLNSLACVKYYAKPSGSSGEVPYGFTYETTIQTCNPNPNAYDVYKNQYQLPLGYTYEGYITEDRWSALPFEKRQESLLYSLVLKNEESGFTKSLPEFTSQNLSYTTSCKGNVSIQDNAFVVDSRGASVTFKFQGSAKSETYVCMEGLSFYSERLPGSVKLKFKSSSGAERILDYRTEAFARYSNRHDFAVNLGYTDDPAASVTLKFPKAGTYCFDSIRIVSCPMKNYARQIEKRRQDFLENVTFDTNSVSGSISLNRPKLLCLSIPYSKGWSAYVDGRKTKLHQANVMYMALALEEGTHDVRLTYATPLKKEGTWISIASLLVFVVLVRIQIRKYTH